MKLSFMRRSAAVLFCIIFAGRMSPQSSHTSKLSFEFTKSAITVLKEIIRINGSPAINGDQVDVSAAMLDDLDTQARTTGETKAVELLGDLRAAMSVNNVERKTLYYKNLLKESGSGSSERAEALRETMSDSKIKIITTSELACTTSIDRMLRSGIFTNQPKCMHIMIDLNHPQ